MHYKGSTVLHVGELMVPNRDWNPNQNRNGIHNRTSNCICDRIPNYTRIREVAVTTTTTVTATVTVT